LCRLRKLSNELSAERTQQHELLKQAQESSLRAEHANRAKDEFLAVVSHELRTPLNAIAGWTTLLRSNSVPPERVADALDTIDRNVRAQTRLIDDLLDVSRITSGKLNLRLEPTDMAEVVRVALKALRPTADAKRVSMRSDIASPLPPTLGDATRLQQVVWNLVANALKFTAAGNSVDVNLRQSGAGLELMVQDDGQGIPGDALPIIFDRFRQAESSFTRSHGGLGLGLAIVRHLVELHGGQVSAESAGPGLGSTFRVVLPVVEGAVEAPAAAAGSWPPTVPLKVIEGLRVLLVDDDVDGRDAAALLLRQQGAIVETAGSAQEALTALDRAVPDILLSDIGMPTEDGLSLLRKVRSRATAGGGGIPALALTAYARSEDRAQSLLAGFDGIVTKPIEPGNLILAVARLTGRSSRRPL
jgi:CheY-like chemotaxis protein/nitrogen-specific signal transduction histidine kinase